LLNRTDENGNVQAMVARFTEGKLAWLCPLADYPDELMRGWGEFADFRMPDMRSPPSESEGKTFLHPGLSFSSTGITGGEVRPKEG
jgi:hypothetical protein